MGHKGQARRVEEGREQQCTVTQSRGTTCELESEHIQWNLSIKDTAGTQLAVLYREVSLTQR